MNYCNRRCHSSSVNTLTVLRAERQVNRGLIPWQSVYFSRLKPTVPRRSDDLRRLIPDWYLRSSTAGKAPGA